MSSRTRPTTPPFLRLDPRTGWRLGPAESHPGVLDDGASLLLGVPGRVAISATEPFGSFGGRTLPRGMAVTDEGRIFLADPDRRVILTWQVGAPPHDGETRPFRPLWSARPLPVAAPHDVTPPAHPPGDPYTLVRPTDVAMSPSGDLVIVDPGAGRVVVIAYPSARVRRVIAVPAGAPTAVAFDDAGRAYVADPGRGTVDRYDRWWRRDPSYPHRSTAFSEPEQVAAARRSGERDRGAACGCDGCQEHREADLLVLDRNRVIALDGRGRVVETGAVVPDLVPGPLQLEPGGGLLYLDAARPWLDPLGIPGVSLTRDGRHLESGLPLVALPSRVALPRSGSFTTAAMDGGRPGFAWDRIVLRADLPANTRVLVRTLTSDSALEFDRMAAAPDSAWSLPLTIRPDETPEVLVQSQAGRYLWLRVELFGDGRTTPRISGLDIHGPRHSTVRHLPAGFHQDPESLRFLDRFLTYFDTVFAEITAANRDIVALFDPRAVPEGEPLAWLGRWFDLEFLAEWSPDLRRRMIAQAVAYARTRGTVAGLQQILRWHTGLSEPMPQIIEHFRLPEGPVMVGGEPLERTSVSHTCTLVLPDAVVPDATAHTRLERLIAEHAPAHVCVHLRLVTAGVAVGRQATIGVDTLLGGHPSGALGRSRLGAGLATAPPRPRGLVPDLMHPHRRSQPC